MESRRSGPGRSAALVPSVLYSLAGRTAPVTGASGGLGFWLAAERAAARAEVMLSDRAGADLAPLASLLEAESASVDTAEADWPT
jgi:short-subunit dehydrogenase